ncbi:MAG: histidinol-phosphatase HisJ family protein [Duncaniella sp.]|nr:histidinol-phosphatase HisJ family protein [Duncaniella sp.]
MLIDDIVSSTTRYNLHSHTQYCDGRFTMDEFAAAAAANGMSHYGFSPHSPVPIESPCNMAADDVDEFLATVSQLNDEYCGRTRFYAAMEIDFLGEKWGAANEYFRNLPLDYRISSVHFIPALSTGEEVDIDGSPERFIKRLGEYFNNDIRYVVDTFYDRTRDMITAGGFDIIGHFDKIGLNASVASPGIEDEPWYRRRVDEIMDLLADKDIFVEINTKAFAQRNRFFPAERCWKQLADRGLKFVVNSDAHFTDLIDASRDEALRRLSAYTN